MPDKMLAVIAVFDDETNAALAKIYMSLREMGMKGTQTRGIPYHLTLGTYPTSEKERLTSIVDKVAPKTAPIPMRIGHIGAFGLKVLFAEPSVNIELISLLREFSPECGSGEHTWVAHATLLIDEPENIEKAFPVAAKLFTPMRSVIKSIALYEFFPPELLVTRDLTGV